MSQFQVTKYCGSSKPFLVHPAKYICKTAVMKIPKNCPQWNTERCLLRETLSMIFQFHLRVSHPSSLLRNSLGPLVFPPSASKNLLYCWDACIKPFEKKESTNLNVFFSGVLKKSRRSFSLSKVPGLRVSREWWNGMLNVGTKDPGEAGAKGWFIVEWNMVVLGEGSCGSYPYRKQGTWRSMEKSIIF